jgi:LysM repeat protein
MRIVTFIKILAAMVVLAVIGATGYLVHAVKDEVLTSAPAAEDVSKMLEETELPDVDPGERVFQRALEMVAMGERAEAKDKLLYIFNFHPASPSAGEARRILGEMNLDEILSTESMDGKSTHKVVRGDSYLKIAAKNDTTLEAIMYFNGLTSLEGLFPGDELVVMPLNFRLIIEPGRRTLSLWQKDKLLKEYPLVRPVAPGVVAMTTKIESKAAFANGKKLSATDPGLRDAQKMLTLARTQLHLQGLSALEGEDPGRGFFLSAPDMEELTLLMRPGNEVEIRVSSR